MKEKSPIPPPRFAQRILRWYCPDNLYEEIEGDLLEAFDLNVAKRGEQEARMLYAWDVLRFFQPDHFPKGPTVAWPNLSKSPKSPGYVTKLLEDRIAESLETERQ